MEMETEIKKEICKWITCLPQQKFDIDSQLSSGQQNTLLMEAIKKKKENIVRYLIDHGASVTKTNKLGIGSLEFALRYDPSIIPLLLDKDGVSDMIKRIKFDEITIPPPLLIFLLDEIIRRNIIVTFATISSFRDYTKKNQLTYQQDLDMKQRIAQLPRDPLDVQEQQYHAILTRLIDNGYDYHLSKELTNALFRYQDEKCLSGDRTGNSVDDLVCRLSMSIKANPVSQTEKERNGSLVNGKPPINQGSYGEIYADSFDGQPIITKRDKQFSTRVLQEAVINFCIINQFCKQPKRFPSLVPTFGFFLCEQEPAQFQKAGLAQICTSKKGLGVQSHLYIVQKKIENTITFTDFLHTDQATLESVQRILYLVFSQLQELQQSEYKIYHGDLHSGNILVSPDGRLVYIIDWGFASFSINGVRYRGPSEEKYQNQFHDRTEIVTGMVDFYFLLHSLFSVAKLQVIRRWARDMRNLLFNERFLKDNDSLLTYDTFVTMDGELVPFGCTFQLKEINGKQEKIYIKNGPPHLYKFLRTIERSVYDQREQVEVHNTNVEYLNRHSYEILLTAMIMVDDTVIDPRVLIGGGKFRNVIAHVTAERQLGKLKRSRKKLKKENVTKRRFKR